MTLNHLNLAVTDPDRASGFYQRWFGFTEVLREDDFIKVRDDAGFELSLTLVEEAASYPASFHFGFRKATPEAVRDLHTRMAEAGVGVRVGLREAEDRVFFLGLDPDGHRIEIYWES